MACTGVFFLIADCGNWWLYKAAQRNEVACLLPAAAGYQTPGWGATVQTLTSSYKRSTGTLSPTLANSTVCPAS